MSFIYHAITDFIFMEDDIEPADIILVPGGSHVQLIEHAAELYHNGLAPYILPSGGKNSKLMEYKSEWEYLYEQGKKLGVPEEAMLREDQASNTFENAKFSLNIIDEKKLSELSVRKVILVCKNYHSRRAYLSYASVFPRDVRIMVSPIIDGNDIRKDNWFLDKAKIHKVMGEVVKIGNYFEHHIINDISGVVI